MDFLDPIFNAHKIKFDILDKWNLIDKQTTQVNVYINLENVFRLIMTSRTNNFIQAASSMDAAYRKDVSLSLVSNIINLGQHYRLWLTKHNIDSRILLYWDYPLPESYKNQTYIPHYRSIYQDRYASTMENANILECLIEAYKFLKTCIQYVNEVYLIETGSIESSLIPLVLDRNVYHTDGIRTRNLLVTNSPYEYPYVNYGFTILSTSIKKGKEPIKITNQSAIEVLKQKNSASTTLSVDSNFLEFINAICGDSDRGIPKLSGVGLATILKMISVAITKGLITESTKDIDMLKAILKNDTEVQQTFVANYHCTNFEYQLKEIEPLDIHRLEGFLVDKYDENTLNTINEKYFKRFPIEIIKPKSQQILYDTPNTSSIFDR